MQSDNESPLTSDHDLPGCSARPWPVDRFFFLCPVPVKRDTLAPIEFGAGIRFPGRFVAFAD
jgi:hypothetical protein